MFCFRDYNGRDVTLILNGKASFYSIRYIAVYDDINGKSTVSDILLYTTI